MIRVMLAAGLFTFGCVWAASYMTNPNMFIYTYALSFGIGKGIMYSTALHSAISHLPGRKGVVSGFVICGFGFGGFIFGLICNALSNPTDERPIIYQTPNGPQSLFGVNVADRVPFMLRRMCLIWIGLFIFSLCTITRYKSDKEIQETSDSPAVNAEHETNKNFLEL